MSKGQRKVLHAFLSAPGHRLTTAELCRVEIAGGRYGARIHELEHAHGCHFEKRCLRQGSWLYTLVSWPVEVGAGLSKAGADPGGNDAISPDHGRDRDGALVGVDSDADPGEAPSLFPDDIGHTRPAHDQVLEDAA